MRSQDDLHEAAGWSDQWKFIGLTHTNVYSSAHSVTVSRVDS